MANKSYLGDVGTLLKMDAGVSLVGANAVKIKYRKPSGDTGEWVGSINTQYVEYTTQVGDLDETGRWRLHIYVDNLTGWTGHGEMVSLHVYALWSG